ncbi:hypothetical protein [Vibrio scophthalmi]|uniref:Prophage MuSo2, tail fiber protein, putative n=1 Tax=Vibrio scophthalmi LMG 19158 TaxID=870967 RepID=F9RTI1_9VIBR|nr:hypothetical protein [Vibrio scophthalmi]EGU31079.1 prophage MuSo2, tail fiber protein, putative [Vibrio scophthalmi LMG 19158]
MHPLQNGTQAEVAPSPKPKKGEPGYFTESGESGLPSIPGADWFNAVIKEFQNALTANGVAFNPDNFDHLQKLFAANGDQFAPYRADRVYRYGEVCSTIVNGQIKFWQWYSNTESLAGKDPLNEANRRPGWSDTAKSWYWSPFNGSRPGETVWWGGSELPEDVILDNEQELPVVVYHRLAVARPDLVSGGVIRMKPASGRYLRAANGSNYIAGEIHGDAIRNITASISALNATNVGQSPYGAFYLDNYNNTGTMRTPQGSAYNGFLTLAFDTSRIVPVANQNQPVTLIEWKGVAI